MQLRTRGTVLAFTVNRSEEDSHDPKHVENFETWAREQKTFEDKRSQQGEYWVMKKSTSAKIFKLSEWVIQRNS